VAEVGNTVRRLVRPALIIGATVVALLVMALAGWTAYDLYWTRRNHQAYDRLMLGMTAAQVREVAGREPDCVVGVGRSSAWFFGDAWGIAQCPSGVKEPSALPRAYDSLQVLVAADGRVIAYALDGESGLTSAKGPARGQSLSELPREHLE
jgi:hypothetical protein